MLAEWAVLGAGAIGGLFARRLHDAGIPVTLLSRGDRATRRTLSFFSEESREARVLTFRQSLLSDTDPIDHMLVTTKSPAVLDALQAVSHRLQPGASVVIMVNGLGWQEPLRRHFAESRLYAASTTAGCHRPDRDTLIEAGSGSTRLGTLDPGGTQPAWWNTWVHAVPQLEWCHDMSAVLMEKLAINAVINPLTALHDVSNGALLQPPLDVALSDSTREVSSLLQAAGHEDLAQRLPAVVRRVAADTAANSSSMREDVRAGRSTEVDAILGYLLRKTSAAKIDSPVLSALFNALMPPDPDR